MESEISFLHDLLKQINNHDDKIGTYWNAQDSCQSESMYDDLTEKLEDMIYTRLNQLKKDNK